MSAVTAPTRRRLQQALHIHVTLESHFRTQIISTRPTHTNTHTDKGVFLGFLTREFDWFFYFSDINIPHHDVRATEDEQYSTLDQQTTQSSVSVNGVHTSSNGVWGLFTLIYFTCLFYLFLSIVILTINFASNLLNRLNTALCKFI